jgi:hypothetical protein
MITSASVRLRRTSLRPSGRPSALPSRGRAGACRQAGSDHRLPSRKGSRPPAERPSPQTPLLSQMSDRSRRRAPGARGPRPLSSLPQEAPTCRCGPLPQPPAKRKTLLVIGHLASIAGARHPDGARGEARRRGRDGARGCGTAGRARHRDRPRGRAGAEPCPREPALRRRRQGPFDLRRSRRPARLRGPAGGRTDLEL